MVEAGYAKAYPAGFKGTRPPAATEHEPDAWKDIDEMECQTNVVIESSCGCNIPGCKDAAAWKHDKGCQLYEPPEASPDAEPFPFEFEDLELTSAAWIKSNCACVGCNLPPKIDENLSVDEYPLPEKPKTVLPHQHDLDCHLFIPEPSPSHEPYPDLAVTVEMTAYVIIESKCACKLEMTMTWQPWDHEKGCHLYQEARFYLPKTCPVDLLQIRQ